MAVDGTKDRLIRRRLIYGTAVNYAAKIATLAVGFLLTPFLLGRLGASDYGLWVLASSIVAYGSLFDLGISSAVTKYVAEHVARDEHEEASRLVATALRLYAGLGLVACVAITALALVFADVFNVAPENRVKATQLVLLMGAQLGLTLATATGMATLRGLQLFGAYSALGTVGTLLSAGVSVLALLLGAGVVGLVAANLPVTLIMFVASVSVVRQRAPRLRFGWAGADRRLVGRIASFSGSLFLVDVAGRLQTKTDEVVIGAFMPVAAVTPYALARKLSEAVQTLTDQFVRLLMPLASELHATDDLGRLRALYAAGTRVTLLISLPVGVALVMLAGPLLSVWVGTAYASYAPVVVILAAAALVDMSTWPAGMVLQGMARHQPVAIASIVSGLGNLGLSVLFVGPLGVEGVALATLIVSSIECLGFILPYATRTLGLGAVEALRVIAAPLALPALAMVAVLWLARESLQPMSLAGLAAVAGLATLAYAAVYLTVGASTTERELCRALVSSTRRLAAERLARA